MDVCWAHVGRALNARLDARLDASNAMLDALDACWARVRRALGAR